MTWQTILYFSSILLTCGVTGFLAWQAWRQRSVAGSRYYFWLALAMCAAALVTVAVTIITVFDFLPQNAFNPIIPGFGLTALLAAAAIFRFGFLKSAPAAQDAGRRQMEAQEKRSQALFLLVFGLMVTGIAAVGYLYYRNYAEQFRAQVEAQLSAVASLKMDELETWRAERLGDAEVLHQNLAFSTLFQRLLEEPDDAPAQAELQTWLDSLRDAYQYQQVYLLDTGGTQRMSSSSDGEPVAVHLLTEITPNLQGGEVTFLDFHLHDTDQNIHLAILVPLYAGHDLNRPLGVLVLDIDPATYLYPYLSQWPVPNETAESLLVRRDGDEVLFLSPLRFQPNAALNLRIPLADTDVLAVKAILGRTGVVEGMDYRSQGVIGYIGPVPNSPWYLVARMDISEVYAPLRQRLWQTVLFFGALVAASGAGLFVVWRQQRLRRYRERYEAAEELRVSEERFRLAFQITPDAVAITRLADGRFVSANQGFEQTLGYSEQEVIGKTSLELGLWVNPADRERIVAGLQASGSVSNYEAQFRAKNGESRHGLMSAAIIEINGEKHILNTTRDITERKQAEQALQDNEAFIKAVLENLPVGVAVNSVDPNVTFSYMNDNFPKFYRTTRENLARPDAFWEAVYEDPVFREEIRKKVLDGTASGDEERMTWEDVPIARRGEETHFITARNIPVPGKPLVISTVWDVTERKQAEELVKKSEAQYRLLFENNPLPMWVYDLETLRFLAVNEAATLKYGYSKEEFLSMTLMDIRPAEDVSALVENVAEASDVFQDTGPWRHRTKDGQIVFVEIISHSMDYFGKPARLVMVNDITERKQAEEALQASQKLLQDITDNSTSLIYALDTEGRFLLINRSLEAVLGAPRETLIGKTREAILPAEVAAAHRANDIRVIESLQPELMEEENIEADGKHTYLCIKFPLVGPQGAIYGVSGISTDITERKRAEEERALLFNTLAASLNEIYIFDSQTLKFQFVNSGALRNLQISLEEARQLTPLDIKPEFTEADFQQLIAPLRTGEKRVQVFKTVHQRADGTRYPVEVHLQLFEKEHAFLAVIQDITDRKRVEKELAMYTEKLEELVDERTRELREAQEKLVRQERLAVLGQLAGSVGHELRNPLGVISNAAHYLQMSQPGASEKVKDYLHIIEAETRTAEKIITDLLNFSRIKNLDRGPVDVTRLVEQTLERYPAPESVIVRRRIARSLPPVFADSRQMTQVLGNLLVNAYQAMEGSGKVTVSARRDAEMVAISVADTGPGISPENIKRIFEPLFTTKIRGIGLGLAVSQRFVEANGGRLEVQSEPGKGSTFTVVLPIQQEDNDE